MQPTDDTLRTDHGRAPNRPLVVIPTYNEAANLEEVVDRTVTAVPGADILVVDDNSPDGTGLLADALAARDHGLHVLHRPGKSGLGTAYRDGFAWALGHDYGAIVEMDADGSHQPEQLPHLLAELEASDVVLGARWVPGGRVEDWSRARELLSRIGNAYVRLVLRLPLHDATGGFRVYRRSALERLGLDDVESTGYCFQVDLADRAVRRGLRVSEVPILFRDRTRGASKMSPAIALETLLRVTGWAFSRRRPAYSVVPG